ncbi:MAG: hypothetical protein R3E18_06115 [Sphingomonadaceae bacterium]|nr:hypothetical protein [Sphingomonadaceae bacterium]
MTTLPPIVRRLPTIFYALGALFFLWSIGNSWVELAMLANPYGDIGMQGIENLAKSKSLYQASVEAAYMVANGAVIHVLIAIFDRLRGAAE